MSQASERAAAAVEARVGGRFAPTFRIALIDVLDDAVIEAAGRLKAENEKMREALEAIARGSDLNGVKRCAREALS